MLIVGERINSTRSSIREAIEKRDAAFIAGEARRQIGSGAHFIDVNCAVTSGDELQDMDWAISVLQSEIKPINICIDSPNHRAIEKALSVYKSGGELMINSITGEEERISKILPLAKKYNTKLIALTMDENGMPNTAEERYGIAERIFERIKKDGFDTKNLYFDPLIRPVSTEPIQAKEFLKALPMIKNLGDAKTVCGLSNVSFGLPDRGLVNAIFLSMAMQAGLDSAIIDPSEKRMFSSLKAAEALLANDEYCAEYIKAFRDGKLI